MKNVTVAFGDNVVLKDVSFQIHEGESVVIIGPSGHGKTVLLKTLAGVHKPQKGNVYVEGEDWQSLESDEKHLLAEKMGMLFQKSALFDSMTALENIIFPIREHHPEIPENKLQDRARELLELVNLSKAEKKYPHELSGGMQRRLGIARALALSPKIVFYDDPTAGQDPVQSDAMADHILKIKEQYNSTLITVTCDLLRAHQMGDRILMVVDQEVLDLGTPDKMKDNPDPRVQQFLHGRVDGPIRYN